MATISEMVSVVADEMCLEYKNVYGYARHLRNAGLIKSNGRGPSSAVMSHNDVRNLIYALMLSSTPGKAVEYFDEDKIEVFPYHLYCVRDNCTWLHSILPLSTVWKCEKLLQAETFVNMA